MSNCQDRSVGPGPFTLTPSGTGKCATSGGPPSGTGSALVVVVVLTSLGAVPLGSGGNEVVPDADRDGDGDAEVDADGDASALGSPPPPQPATTASASSEPDAAAARTARVLVTVDPPGQVKRTSPTVPDGALRDPASVAACSPSSSAPPPCHAGPGTPGRQATYDAVL